MSTRSIIILVSLFLFLPAFTVWGGEQSNKTKISTAADWTVESDQEGAHFGGGVSSAGDVNGDGFDDVIVGAFCYDNAQKDEGGAFVFFGSASGLSTTADWTAESDQEWAWFGFSVSSAGDVNGDGYDDVIVGAPGYNNDEGQAFVFFGSPSGLSTTPDWTTESDQADAHFCYSVSSAGDVNGDGFDDVIVGASLNEKGQGRAFVYHGSPSGLSLNADWIGYSPQAYSDFAYSVSSAGDVNGDGFDDVIVGAAGNLDDEGRAFVFFGSASGLSPNADWTAESDQESASFGHSVSSAGDVNGDGCDDVIVGAPSYDNVQNNEGGACLFHGSSSGLSTNPDWTAASDWEGACFGSTVSSAGDVNGNGYDDVIVGAPIYGEWFPGRAFMFFGSASGLSATAFWTHDGLEIDQLGTSVSSAGDVNGDGYDDVIVGAPFYENDQYAWGRALVFHGSYFACEIGGVSYSPGETHPDNVCLICNPPGSTSEWSDNDGASCDDGLFCNGEDTCLGGACAQHPGDPCDPQCQSCNEDADACEDVAGPCDDGLFCNGGDTCSTGTCSQHEGDPCSEEEACNEEADECFLLGDDDDYNDLPSGVSAAPDDDDGCCCG